jgi:hypothetical protein
VSAAEAATPGKATPMTPAATTTNQDQGVARFLLLGKT